MSTRSVICKETLNKTYVGIYCHHDGYPLWVGKTLLDHYSDRDRVEKLLHLGDLSSLEEKIEPDADKIHTFDNPQGDVCVAYHRDRGEELRQARPIKLDKAHEVYWAEFMYVYMQDGTWYFADLCSNNPILIPLTRNYTEYEDEDE